MGKKPKVNDYYLDHVGRRRKLSHGAILRIQQQFYDGAVVAELAEAYDVSTSLIRTITYNTARRRDLGRINDEG